MGGLAGDPHGVAGGVAGDHLALVDYRVVGEDRGKWEVK